MELECEKKRNVRLGIKNDVRLQNAGLETLSFTWSKQVRNEFKRGRGHDEITDANNLRSVRRHVFLIDLPILL